MPRDIPAEPFVSLVLVSHSAAVADGVAELVAQVAGPGVRIVTVGGGDDGMLGTDGGRVAEALRQAADTTGGVVLMDIGSTVLAVRAALAEMTPLQRGRIIAADAPLVEGAIAAGVAASTGGSAEDVARAAEEARRVTKM
jgi:PTS hybrid protein